MRQMNEDALNRIRMAQFNQHNRNIKENIMQHSTGKAITRLVTYLRLRVLALGMVGGLSLIACHTAMAQCVSVLRDGDFELQRSGTVSSPWITEGRSG